MPLGGMCIILDGDRLLLCLVLYVNYDPLGFSGNPAVFNVLAIISLWPECHDDAMPLVQV